MKFLGTIVCSTAVTAFLGNGIQTQQTQKASITDVLGKYVACDAMFTVGKRQAKGVDCAKEEEYNSGNCQPTQQDGRQTNEEWSIDGDVPTIGLFEIIPAKGEGTTGTLIKNFKMNKDSPEPYLDNLLVGQILVNPMSPATEMLFSQTWENGLIETGQGTTTCNGKWTFFNTPNDHYYDAYAAGTIMNQAIDSAGVAQVFYKKVDHFPSFAEAKYICKPF